MSGGIDYGNGLTNIDEETGIRYGVISSHEVLQAWADNSEAQFACDECPDNKEDEECGGDCDPYAYEYNEDGYQAFQQQDDVDIMITKSPFYTYCKFCSPCAPGAGYLMDYFKMSDEMPRDENLPLGGYAAHAVASGYTKAYCFDHEWFDSGRAPYVVFNVETDEVVQPVE